MAISYNKLIQKLYENGWSTYKIRKEKLLGQYTLTALRADRCNLDTKTINRMCAELHCQPGDIMEYVEDVSDN